MFFNLTQNFRLFSTPFIVSAAKELLGNAVVFLAHPRRTPVRRTIMSRRRCKAGLPAAMDALLISPRAVPFVLRLVEAELIVSHAWREEIGSRR
jgi:hypothetical protein